MQCHCRKDAFLLAEHDINIPLCLCWWLPYSYSSTGHVSWFIFASPLAGICSCLPVSGILVPSICHRSTRNWTNNTSVVLDGSSFSYTGKFYLFFSIIVNISIYFSVLPSVITPALLYVRYTHLISVQAQNPHWLNVH